MQFRTDPKTGNSISILGYGAMRLPSKGLKIDFEEAKKQLLFSIKNGINYIDTAWPYHNGESEVFLGKVLSENNLRSKVFLADKLPTWVINKREDMDNILAKQLSKLQTSYIDYYLVHSLDGTSWDSMKALQIKSFLEEIKQKGLVKNVGFSFHGPRADFLRIVDEFDWDFCQIQYNILDEQNQAGKAGLEYAAARGLGIIVMEPLRGGNLAAEMPKEAAAIYNSSSTKRTNVEWALRWIWNHPEVLCVLSGMNNMEHIKENLSIANEALPNSLTVEELDIVQRVGNKYRKAMKVHCTGCQYCMPCPFGVNISGCFEHYNTYQMFGKKFMAKAFYQVQLGGIVGENKSMASLCTACGKCVSLCPQNINIPKEMQNVKKSMEGFFINPLMKIIGRMMKKQS